MNESETIELLAAALVKAQGEFPIIAKKGQGKVKGTSKTGNAYEYEYKYAELPEVVEVAKPILLKHGLAVSQHVSHTEAGGSLLKTYLVHESGQYLCEAMPLLLPKEDPQGQGSAITYARRYSYMSVLGLVADEDDDAGKASQPGTKYHKPEPTKPKAASKESVAELLIPRAFQSQQTR